MQSIIISEAVKNVVRTVAGRQDVVVGRTNWLHSFHASLCASFHALRRDLVRGCDRAYADMAERARRMASTMSGATPAPAYAGAKPARGQRLSRRVTAPDLG